MSTLEERYPTTRRTRIFLFIGVGLLAIAFLGWLLWTTLYHVDENVAGRIESFKVLSDNEVQATLVVDRADPSRPAQCELHSQATSYERVGEQTLQIAPGKQKIERIPVTLRTFKRATTITVNTCTLK